MTSRFARSYMKQKNIRFIVQIGDYSKYICKGYYNSPEFGDGESETKWSLLVHVYDGGDHENFIDVRLKRDDYVSEEQYINVKISIISCIGLNVLKKESKILLSNSDEAQILSVAKEHLKEYFGLKKFFYLPCDTLTLQCDLIIHESNVFSYKQQQQEVPLSSVFNDRRSSLEYYFHSRLLEENYDYFEWEIYNFSVHTYGGRSTGPLYQSNRLGGFWCLVVCNSPHDYTGSSLDVRIMRLEGYEDQLMKVKLSIIDSSGEVLKSNEKNVFFTSSREVQLLTFTEKEKPGWFELKKNDLVPGDKLHLHCEMILYKQREDRFSRQEDFDKSIKSYGYAPFHLIPYLPFICIILAASLYLCYSLCLAVMLFLWHIILEFLVAMKYFIIAVFILTLVFLWVKQKAESIKEKQKAIEMKKKLREERKLMLYNQLSDYGADSYLQNDVYYYNGRPRNHNQNYYGY